MQLLVNELVKRGRTIDSLPLYLFIPSLYRVSYLTNKVEPTGILVLLSIKK